MQKREKFVDFKNLPNMWVNQDESDLQTSEYDICAWLTCTTNNRNVKIWGIKITTYTIHYACVQYVVSVIVSRSFFTIWRCRTKHWIDPGVLAICVCVCVCVCACVCVCVCSSICIPTKGVECVFCDLCACVSAGVLFLPGGFTGRSCVGHTGELLRLS